MYHVLIHPQAIGSDVNPVKNARKEAYQMRQEASLSANRSAAANLKQQLKSGIIESPNGKLWFHTNTLMA